MENDDNKPTAPGMNQLALFDLGTDAEWIKNNAADLAEQMLGQFNKGSETSTQHESVAPRASAGRIKVRPQPIPRAESWQDRFPGATEVHGAEGGSVYVAQNPDGFHIITCEGALADFVDDDEPVSFVRTFETATDRDTYLCHRGWGPKPS